MRDSTAIDIESQKKSEKKLQKPLFRFFLLNLLFLIINIVIILFLTGCQTKDKETAWINSIYPINNWRNTNYNPNFVFDSPKVQSERSYINSEVFGRAKWPASEEAKKYVSQNETITYDEKYYSDQYINGNHIPRERFHRRISGHRQGISFR